MFIHKIQIFNYKSYIDSNIIEFSPNINIIVGQNNSGKTALLECLTLKLPSKPHLSIKTLPSPFTKINEESHAKVYLLLTKEELIIFLEQIPLPLGIAVPDDEAYSGEPTEALIVFKRFQGWLEDKAHSHVELCLSLSSNPQYELEKGKITKNLNFNLYSSSENQDHTYNFIEILLDDNRKVNVANIKFCYDEYYRNYTDEVVDYGSFKADYKSTIAYKVFNLFRERIYRFYAERLNISNCSYGNSSLLKPNASNLGEVLYLLPNKNPENFILLNQHISYIFPHIKNVSVVNTNNSQLEIKIWTKEASQYKREDLTIPLSECGTGVGQVIAIIYVLITSQFPTVIIIDEPQSFLHPGAAKKLIEIIKAFPQHQYFIASHSPDIITTANPSNIIKLQYQDSETKALVINTRNIKSQDEILRELGVNLSDIFGADYILWVEGPTEEKCFPLILEQVAKKQLNATKILAVKNTGDLEGKRAEIIFDIYDKLSGGNNLFPPTIGFILDRENKSETEIQDLQRRSKKPVKFIKRRMYENYLIHPDAILYVINKHDIYRQHPLNQLEIEQWINNEKENKNYVSKDIKGNTLLDDEWFKVVDGANLLKDLFRHFTENRVAFSKTKHSLEITEWLIKNKCDSLHELSSFLVNSFFISQIIDEVKK